MTGSKIDMKTYSSNYRNSLVLLATCLLFGGFAATSQAFAADPQSGRAEAAPSLLVRPVHGAARLIISRAPDLGNFVIVRLAVDGAPAASIGYGHTYQGFLSPGRHVLSLLPTPSPKWLAPWRMTLDARSGHTYNFTAMGNSGYVILRAPGEPEIPRAR